MTAGGPRKKDGDVRFKVRPVMIRDRLLFQMETFRGNQAFHRNLNEEEACEAICEAMTGFRQLSIKTEGFEAEAMVSKESMKRGIRRSRLRPCICHITGRKNIFWRKAVPFPS